METGVRSVLQNPPERDRSNGETGAREAGKMRSEGKEYVTQDGDVMLFRFNV